MQIYYLQNRVNGKIYVGQTSTPLEIRIARHEYSLNKSNHYNKHLQRDWDKYGIEGFKARFLEDGFNTIEELYEAEKFWISTLKSRVFQHGYNIHEGGEIEDPVIKLTDNLKRDFDYSKARGEVMLLDRFLKGEWLYHDPLFAILTNLRWCKGGLDLASQTMMKANNNDANYSKQKFKMVDDLRSKKLQPQNLNQEPFNEKFKNLINSRWTT